MIRKPEHCGTLRRAAGFSVADSRTDTIESGYRCTQLELRGAKSDEDALLLRVRAVQNHLVNYPFSREQARMAA